MPAQKWGGTLSRHVWRARVPPIFPPKLGEVSVYIREVVVCIPTHVSGGSLVMVGARVGKCTCQLGGGGGL